MQALREHIRAEEQQRKALLEALGRLLAERQGPQPVVGRAPVGVEQRAWLVEHDFAQDREDLAAPALEQLLDRRVEGVQVGMEDRRRRPHPGSLFEQVFCVSA